MNVHEPYRKVLKSFLLSARCENLDLEGLLSRTLVFQNSCIQEYVYASICIHIQPDIPDAKVTTQDNSIDLRVGPRGSVFWDCGPLVWGTGAQGHFI